MKTTPKNKMQENNTTSSNQIKNKIRKNDTRPKNKKNSTKLNVSNANLNTISSVTYHHIIDELMKFLVKNKTTII